MDSCTFWREIKSSGKRNAYKSIFESRNVETVVDTSKHPLWLEDQLRYSAGERYSIKSIVIYKEPKEFARSLEKRGRLGRWKSMWVRRYKWIFSITNSFTSIRYKDLVNRPKDTIQKLCDKEELEYYDKKEEFWKNDNSHFLFGSGKAKNANEIIEHDKSYDIGELEKIDEKIDKSGDVIRVLNVLDKNNVFKKGLEDGKGISDVGEVKFPLYVYRRAKTTRFYWFNRLFHKIFK
ncbi:hypothetical protein [Salinibacter ruber]|uniref:hypothetical protein n=1 Tax=Salinibacter ruber TaxID=146919 RepID=UPI0020739924|nr:hypothetical protein [Salinibacter ruber]